MPAPNSTPSPNIFDALQKAVDAVAVKKADADAAHAKADAAQAAFDAAVRDAQAQYTKVQEALAHISPPSSTTVRL